MNISPATRSDIPQLCDLLELLFSQEAEFHPNRGLQSAGLRQIIENPDSGQILVLREGRFILGMVSLLSRLALHSVVASPFLKTWSYIPSSEVTEVVLVCYRLPSTWLGRPNAVASLSQIEHVGMVLSGRAMAAMKDGTEVELMAGSLFYVPPVPHDSWVIGDEPYVSIHFLGADQYAT